MKDIIIKNKMSFILIKLIINIDFYYYQIMGPMEI